MNCLICQSTTAPYLVTTVLQKYQVSYTKCTSCGFIATESPFWLDEAYSNAITSLDIGLPRRNLHWMPVVESMIRKWFRQDMHFLDFGGGYGLFVRIMRDQGFDFYRQDTYCENLFAKQFDISSSLDKKSFELITAFEVFEHLPDPIASVEQMLSYGENILFSTELQPSASVTPETWWYFIPETGQHVSLYTRKSLEQIADRFNLRLYSNNHNLHLLTRKSINESVFTYLSKPKYAKFYNFISPNRPKSLLDSDFTLASQPITHT